MPDWTHSKYGNKWTSYGGRKYHSKREAAYAEELDLLKRAGEIKDWIPQPRFILKVNDIKVGTHVVDFQILCNDGTLEFVEVKGAETLLWKLKRNILLAMEKERFEAGQWKYKVVK